MASHNEQKSELISLLADRRHTLSARKDALEESLNLKHRLIHSARTHPLPIIIGGLVSGFLVARVAKGIIGKSSSTKKDKKHRGIKAFLITSLVAAAKPTVKRWVFEQAKIQVRKRLNHTSAKSDLGGTKNL